MKTTKVAKDKLKDHGESKPTTQKAIQIKQSNKIKEIMSTFSASKPTNVDAQRIVCVLDTLIEKVQVLQYLDNDLVNSINDKTKAQEKEELLAQLSNNAHLLLTRELDYEAQLKPLLSGQDSIDKTADEGSPTIDLGSMIGTTAKNLRNLVRDLQNSPDDLEIVKRLRRNNPLDDYEDFLTYLRGMRLLMLRRLSTSVEEQASHDRQKQELDRKILLWERTKNNKELELRNLKKEKEKYITEKDEELNKLKNLIEEVEMNKSTQLANIKAQSEIEKEAMEKNSKEKEVSLKNRLSTLETELKDLRKKNKDEEQSLREKKGRDEGFLKEIMEQYDEMMESKEQEVHELESELQKVEKEIKDYKESLAILKKEEEKEKEIDKQIVEKKELQKTEKDRIDKIVQSIQDAWKIYKVKAKVGKKKKGKGKDAKGKDGKGGKDAKGKDAKGKTTKR